MLFTFPSRYLCTIGRQGVFRLGGWSPHVQTGFHVPRPTRGSCQTLRLRGYHPLWPAFRDRSASSCTITGLLRFRSPLLAESLLMSFPPGTEMFQFPGFASGTYEFSAGSPIREGFPHSDIRGSTIARISPRLFAACHVLHRLLAPRHPPNALVSLTIQTPKHPHAVPNRATSIPAQNSKRYAYQTTLPFPDSPVKELPQREQVSAEGVSWKRPQLRTKVLAEANRCPAALRQQYRTSREESGAGRSGR